MVKGWEERPLGEIISEARLGGNYTNNGKSTQYPLIKMGNLSRGSINLNRVEYIQSIEPDPNDLLNYGDILFNTRNTPELVGKVAIWRCELPVSYYNSNLMRLKFEECDHFFINYIFSTDEMVKKLRDIAIGTTSVAAIYTRDLFLVTILLPPLSEQRLIGIRQIKCW